MFWGPNISSPGIWKGYWTKNWRQILSQFHFWGPLPSPCDCVPANHQRLSLPLTLAGDSIANLFAKHSWEMADCGEWGVLPVAEPLEYSQKISLSLLQQSFQMNHHCQSLWRFLWLCSLLISSKMAAITPGCGIFHFPPCLRISSQNSSPSEVEKNTTSKWNRFRMFGKVKKRAYSGQ